MKTSTKAQPILRGYLPAAPERNETVPPVEPYLEYRGEHHRVEDLVDRSVHPFMLHNMHMDLTSRTKLPPKLDNDALIQITENYLNQCSGADAAATYEGMLIQHVVPELVKRLKETGD